MRTRGQSKREASVVQESPLKKKNKKLKGEKHKQDNQQPGNKPSKRVKKQKQKQSSSEKEKSPSPVKKGRGRKKKQERIPDKSDSKDKKQKSNKKNEQTKDNDNNKQNDKKSTKKDKQKQQAKKSPQKQKQQKQKSKKKQEQQKSKRKRSPSPQKSKKQKSPQKQVVKKVIVKGGAPVDQYFDKGKDYHVLFYNNKLYTATLNQTNIQHNNNKYFNLQVLQHDKDENKNYFMTRWGRVGTPGQKKIQGPFNINIAIRMYQKKFRDKHIDGQYRQLQMNYQSQPQPEPQPSASNAPNPQDSQLSDYQSSTLPKQTKDLINLIFDLGMMNRQMKQIGYNVNKMPLGKLSKNNIKKGYDILKELYDQIQHSNKRRGDMIEKLTNDFYSYIPHDVGRSNMRLYRLDTLQKVKEKLEMLESLGEIKIATQILQQKQQGNKIDLNYKKLNRSITPIPQDSFTYKLLNNYLQSTHASTHRSYDLELVDLFQLDSQYERDRYLDSIPNKMLLWHGSRLTNFVGILSQGLRIAPPEAPVTGYMFGKGVYFADMSSKSANYCFTTPQNNTGILILCQVALGNCNEKMHADYLASNLPEGKHSTKGVGKTAPKPENYEVLDGVVIPMGPGHQSDLLGSSLLYNQYIVYKIEQIKIKYLLRVKFNYKRATVFS